MAFWSDWIHKNAAPFDLEFVRVHDKENIVLFIDQESAGLNGRRVKGVQLECHKNSTQIYYTMALEPSGNIDALKQTLEMAGFQIRLEPCEFAISSRQKRMRARGREYAGDAIIDEEEAHQVIANQNRYSSMAIPHLKTRCDGRLLSWQSSLSENTVILDRLFEAGFVSESTRKALEAAMIQLHSVRPLEKSGMMKLKETLRNELSARLGDGSGGRPIDARPVTGAQTRF